MTGLNRETLASDDSRIPFGNWGVSTATELCEQADECKMEWIPTEETTETGTRQSLRFKYELGHCVGIEWGLNASPESMAMALSEQRVAQTITSE